MVVFAWWLTDQWLDWWALPVQTRANTDLLTRLLNVVVGGTASFAAAVLAVGTVAGSVREFWRGFRGR